MECFHIKNYTSSRLPLQVWRLTQPGNQTEHRHDCMEMVYVVGGTGVTLVNGRPYPAVRGDLYVMNPQDTHAFFGEDKFSFYNILFRPSVFSREERTELQHFPLFEEWQTDSDVAPDNQNKKFNFAPPVGDQIEALLEAIAKELKSRQPGSEVTAAALFKVAMVKILRNITTGTSEMILLKDSSGGGIPRVVSWINQHYREKLTVSQLAKIAGVSKNYLGECFNRTTGVSPFDYICRLRIEKARQLLENSNRTLTEIAAETGFCDTSYFSRSFRRFTGMSPRDYRTMINRHQ